MQLYNFEIMRLCNNAILQGADQEDLGLRFSAGHGEGQAGLCCRNFGQ